jgi:NAD(P)-dependent dehydrogenase (short-subunit alcohol dehydrogenase family)
VRKARLEGKRAIVTGATRGLGLAIATELAREGARVAITYSKNDGDAEEARKQIAAAAGGTAPLVFKGTVADKAHADDVVAKASAAWGGVDILVNAAGVTRILPIALLEEADWDEVMSVNVKGVYLFSRAVLKPMIRAKQGGHILTIGSFASERVIEAPVHYAAAKSAVRGFTEALAREVGRYGILVNVLAPGLLDVGLGTLLPQHRLDEYKSQCALGRIGHADEIAKLAAFLVSDDNKLMTGAKLAADGGV